MVLKFPLIENMAHPILKDDRLPKTHHFGGYFSGAPISPIDPNTFLGSGTGV